MPVSDISLLIPCHNVANYLPSILRDACRQEEGYSFREVLCYDDGSDDDTSDIASSFGARVIRGDRNRGVAHARNALLTASSSQWVHFHDADDRLDSAFLRHMSACAGAHVDLIVCDRITQPGDHYTSNRGVVETQFLPGFLLDHFIHWNDVVIRRELVERSGGFFSVLRFNEDRDLMVRVALSKPRCVHVPLPLSTWVRRPGSAMDTTAIFAQYRSFLVLYRRAQRRFPPAQRRLVGIKLMHLAWQFHHLGKASYAGVCIRLAKDCGIRSFGTKAPQRLLSRVAGMFCFFRLRRLYCELRHAFRTGTQRDRRT